MSRSPRNRLNSFQLVSQVARVDSRNRIALGKAGAAGTGYTVYRNGRGQILLNPVAAVIPPQVPGLADDPILAADRLSLGEQHPPIGGFGPDSLAD